MEISVITSNVSADFLTPPGVPTWDERKQLLVHTLRDAEPGLIGLQEVTPNQLQFFQAQLLEFTALSVPVANPDPALLPVWRGKYARFGLNEIPSPYEIILFYRTKIFEVLTQGHWWLSPTPERPSIGFGNTAPRVMLWAHLRHRASSREIIVFNTHIDHRCPDEMTELCCQKFVDFTTHSAPLMLIGDLNFNPASPNYALLLNQGWRDAYEVAFGPEAATFLYDLADIPGGRIDHILYQGEALTPQTWARLLSPDPERRLSDHDPVYARFTID